MKKQQTSSNSDYSPPVLNQGDVSPAVSSSESTNNDDHRSIKSSLNTNDHLDGLDLHSSTSRIELSRLSLDSSEEHVDIRQPLTYYEQWYEYDKLRRELKFNIGRCISLLRNRYSFQREKGLDELISILSGLETSTDKEIFSILQKKMDEDTNVISNVVTNILQHTTAGKHALSPVTAVEIYKALLVLEGCCLISSACSNTLATVQGFKFILKILSDGNNYLTSTSKSSPYQSLDFKKDTEEVWDEIRLTCLDCLLSCLHNCPHCVVLFCEDSSGPDVICTILRNKDLSKILRSKCIEFFCILVKLLTNIESDGLHVTNLTERIKVFLGSKLTKDLLDIWKEKDEDLDVIKCDNFVDLVDERL
ncbi:hypothetical protein C9374_000171 [Naegleria lovaniensis]|uniref:Uncharacterized protein n=1 Tax=Naegleria lovaniensis TaxID=51637 RepID=A0AA88GTR8_NAELO|nr:uncharacterized protein C9374_000171 [Naegleria lovaniensis]KAG2388732.1 hypothetical protein C9374_000171 [Naegleria lovaniensis]